MVNKNIQKFKDLPLIRKVIVWLMMALIAVLVVLLIWNSFFPVGPITKTIIKIITITTFFILIVYLFMITIAELLIEKYNDFLMSMFLVLLIMILWFFYVAYDAKVATGVGNLLGYCCKKDTLNFIATGMGGVIAVMVAVAVNRRANAEVENNELTQKGHDDARFQNLTENLGHKKASVRTSAFYRFYYYAVKDGQDESFRNNVFEILCSYLRTMPKETSDYEEKNEEYQPERQTLFDILFKGKFKSKENGLISNDVPVNLQYVRLANMDLTDSNLSSAKLSRANLSNSNLSRANLSDADLSDADLSKATLSDIMFERWDGSTAHFVKKLRTELRNANLLGAKLVSASLSHADFSGADLSHAKLMDADLSEANLSKANLSEANLSEANLSEANLFKANFQGAKLKNEQLQDATNFDGADFRGTDIKLADLPSGKGTPITDE